MRRYLPGALIALALAFAGYWSLFHGYRALWLATMTDYLNNGMATRLPGFMQIHADSPTGALREYPAAWVLTRSYDKEDFPKTAEGFRELARKHPSVERPDLWLWWRSGRLSGPKAHFEEPYPAEPPTAPSGLRPTEEELRATPEEEAWDEAVAFLRERDPDNGWPLVLMACRELLLSTRHYTVQVPAYRVKDTMRDDNRYEVVAPVHAARAARLLHEAVRKPRFDGEVDRVMAVEFERRGGRPETLAGAMSQIAGLAGLMFFSDPHYFREAARRMVGEAERVARLPEGVDDPDPLSAFAILHDLQTMAARLMASGAAITDGLVGVAIVAVASDQGDRILREVGRPDEAERLVLRGRRLIRPWLVTPAKQYLEDREKPEYSGYQPRERTPLIDDPALLAEVAAAWADERDRDGQARDNPMGDRNLGLLSGLLLPALQRLPWTAETMPTLEEIQASNRFEFCALYGMILGLVVFPSLGLALALFLGGYALIRFTSGRGPGPETPPWPGAGWIFAASAVAAALSFGLFWALCYVWVEPLLWLPFERPPWRWEWHGFWMVWTTLAGWHGLAWMAACGARRALPESLRATEGPRWWEKAATAMSWLGLGLALAFFALGYGWGWGEETRTLAFGMFLLPVAGAGLQWLGGVVGGSGGTYARGRERHLLTGLAGWILLWGCFAFYVGEREEELARSERVMVPDAVGRNGSFVAMTVPEGRIVERTRNHVGRVLAEEALVERASER